MSLFTVLVVAISLSMDAFSLALIYGTLDIKKKNMLVIALSVGIFHFFMPLFGYLFGSFLNKVFSFDSNFFIAIIFIFLSIEMFISIFKDEEIELFNGILSILLFSFTVSIDSFSVGIGLGVGNDNNYLAFIIFSIISFLFTYFGLKLGKILSLKFGKFSTLFGSIVLFLLGISHLL